MKSVLELEYPDYEVIVVDNASSDGSFERIRDLVRENGRERRTRIMKLIEEKGVVRLLNLDREDPRLSTCT